MRNLHLLFNKEYYRKLGTPEFRDDVARHNKDILSTRFTENDYVPSAVAKQSFILETRYPGLMIGTGVIHGAGDSGGSNDDFNNGFSFDYVTGQPYIPASSVKGVLRSCFPYYPNRTNPVEEILHSMGYPNVGREDVQALEKAVFDHADVFFDAVVYDGDENGALMGVDYITPHKKATIEPIPILTLKVLPGVRFEFRFIISDKTIGGAVFKADDIKELFKHLLVLFGAGARTNVGYGVFVPLASDIPHRKPMNSSADLRTVGKAEQMRKTEIHNDKPPRIKCPHCGSSNFVYYKNSMSKRKKCYRCDMPLYREGD